MRRVIAFAAATIVTVGASSAFAQEGCKPTQSSCSQMKARCEQICTAQANPSRCVAATCEVALPGCKANGVWAVRGGAACWKTSNRS